MAPRPFDVAIPTTATEGEIIACSVMMLRAFGWDLGDRYDAHMHPKVGDGWLEALRRARLQGPHPHKMYRQPLNLHDPSFGINEPLRNSNSPLRACLPHGPPFYDLLDKVAKIRNKELHFDAIPSLDTLDEQAQVIGAVAVAIGLPVATECARVRARVQQLKAGSVPPPVIPETLARQIEGDRARARKLSAEVAALRSKLRGQEQAGDAALDQIMQQLEAAELAKSAAEEKLGLAQAALGAQLAAARAATDMPDTRRLTPGDAWPIAPPERILRLLAHVGDLFDPVTVDLLSNEVGNVAVAAAARWRTHLPQGGTIHLNEAGQAVALVNHTWTYLGSLDAVGKEQ